MELIELDMKLNPKKQSLYYQILRVQDMKEVKRNEEYKE